MVGSRWPWFDRDTWFGLALTVTATVWQMYGPTAPIFKWIGWAAALLVWIPLLPRLPGATPKPTRQLNRQTVRRGGQPASRRPLAGVQFFALGAMVAVVAIGVWSKVTGEPVIDVSKPRLSGRVVGPRLFGIVDDRPVAGFLVEISNSGFPSVATGWTAYLDRAGGRGREQLQTLVLSGSLEVVASPKSHAKATDRDTGLELPMRLSPKSLFQNKHDPIETGKSQQGYVICRSYYLGPDAFEEGSRVTLGFKDVLGNQYWISTTIDWAPGHGPRTAPGS